MEAARANKLSLVNQVEKAYYALLLAQDSKRVIEENHATAKLNADIFQKKYDLGAASEYDVLRANVAVTNLEPSILEAENSINALKLQLKLLMGMDVRNDFEPSQQLDDFKGEMYARIMSNTLGADTTLSNNTSLKALDLQTDYLKKVLDVQKMAWYPTLMGSASMMWHSMNNGLDGRFPHFPGWTALLQAETSRNRRRGDEVAARELGARVACASCYPERRHRQEPQAN